MLLIGDIHITSRCTDKVLDELRTFVGETPDEKNIIFLGDYVYHFSYDRNALMALYHFFLELFEKGKNVYILAGNHDWLGNTFVFEEAKKAFEIIGKISNIDGSGQMKFITEPMIEEIEGEKILFLPYFIEYNKERMNTKKGGVSNSIDATIQTLSASPNKNEKLSAIVNQILLDYISDHGNPAEDEAGLTVIHHYYINKTKCPGQKSLFNYKDVALHEGFLDMGNIKLISGHLHQSFALKNYICTGSVRSSTSLEVNQNKYLFSYSPSKDLLTAKVVQTNPYLLIEDTGVLTQEGLLNAYQQISKENKNNFADSPVWKVSFTNEGNPNLKDLSLFLKVKNVDYEHMEQFIEDELRQQIKDVKLKKDMQDMGDLMKNLEISGKNLDSTFADRKEILKSYLQNKYPDNYSTYEDILHEMKLL